LSISAAGGGGSCPDLDSDKENWWHSRDDQKSWHGHAGPLQNNTPSTKK
jgi:hypothetical protein